MVIYHFITFKFVFESMRAIIQRVKKASVKGIFIRSFF